MTFNLITAFPNFYDSFLKTSLVAAAIDKSIVKFNVIDLKEFGIGEYKKIDDKPYGGGTGMVLRVDVVGAALQSTNNPGLKIALSPKGNPFKQEDAHSIAQNYQNITLVSGRYEGFDDRVFNLVDKVFYTGSFITMGGEAPSMCIIESILRLKKGVLGNTSSTKEESFGAKYKKEYPLYTKPQEYQNQRVPEILLSGNHKKIEHWRKSKGTVA